MSASPASRPDRSPLVPPGGSEIHRADMTATFSADLTLDSLNLPDHLWLPVDADPDTTLGALVDQNSTGPLRLGYGAWRDLILGCQYRDASDRLISVGGQTMKNVAGYDLTKFMIGQRGIFGKLLTITTRLHLRPTDAFLTEFPPDLAFFAQLLLSDCRPQWSILTPQRLHCGYLGDATTINYYEHQLPHFHPTRWRRQTFQADQDFRRSHWRATGPLRMRASVPPSKIPDFANAAGLTQYAADPAFGTVIAPADPASLAQIRSAATAAGGSAWFQTPDGPANASLDWSPPPAQREILNRLKRSLDPHNRLIPLPWKVVPDVAPGSLAPG